MLRCKSFASVTGSADSSTIRKLRVLSANAYHRILFVRQNLWHSVSWAASCFFVQNPNLLKFYALRGDTCNLCSILVV